MRRSGSVVCIGFSAGLAVLSGLVFQQHTHRNPTVIAKASARENRSSQAAEAYGRLPLAFEQNQGQVADKQVTFLSHGPGYNLFLTSNQAVLTLHKPVVRGSWFVDRGHTAEHFTNHEPRTTNHDAVLRLKLLGANSHPDVSGVGVLPGRANYFLGTDPSKWRTQVPTYSRVAYKQVYPGIDMVYYGNQKQLEYDWIVAPGADVHQIQLGVKGAEKATLTSQGDLMLHTAGGDVVQHAPVAYQEIEGVRKPVSSHLALFAASSGKKEQRIGFEVEAYDHSRPLVIDPVLVYSTFLGGSGGDEGFGIAVDAVGNAYVTGDSDSVDFPTEVPIQSSNLSSGDGYNVFVSELNASGTALLYSTYLGGSGSDNGSAIALDSSGNVYITGGTTSRNFPMKNAIQSTNHTTSTTNAFVTKINATGSALVYSTYLGGSGSDSGYAIAVDSTNNVYVTGEVTSTDFPTKNPYQSANGSSSDGNAFVTKINATGSALVYSTYLGGTGSAAGGDDGNGIAVDSSGDAYVTGSVGSTNFPTANALYSTKPAGHDGDNAFVTKINPAGSALIYSTYLGGTTQDEGNAIAVDSTGNAYITGQTSSTDFPTAGSSVFQSVNHGVNNAFLTKINPTGSALIYSTYLGGSVSDQGLGVAVDSAGEAYVTGPASSANFPTLNPIQATLNGGFNAFVVKMNAAGSALLYSTFLGGSDSDQGNAIALDSYGNAYVTGQAQSLDFPVQSGFQATNHSLSSTNADNGFIAKIGNYNWQTVDVTVGSDSLARLLWIDTDQKVGLWTVNSSGDTSSLSNLGPYTGYTVQATTAGADGLTRMLWNKTDGTAGLWILNANNTYKAGYNFGPFTQTTAVDVTVGSDNKARLLWTAANGAAAIWTVDNSGVVTNETVLGPYAGWTASRIATGSDGYSRLLWTKTDGTVGVWLLNSNNTYKNGFNFGPYTGWRGIDVAVGSDNKARLLWNKSDGTAGVWTIDNTGAYSNLTNVGPYAGWTATRIAAGKDGLSRLLWYKGDGTQGLWLLNANNSYLNGFNFGPY